MKDKQKKVYLEIFNAIINSMKELLGSKVAIIYARKAPIVMTMEGKVTDFYGEGEVVLEILLSQYESLMGDVCHKPIKRAIKEILKKTPVKVPERIRPD